MSRDIKFRAYFEHSGLMEGFSFENVYDDGFIDGERGSLDGTVYCKPDVRVMQFTGLLDRHGVEIYEGDIVLGRFIEEHVPDEMWLTLSDQEREQGFRLFTIKTIFEPYETPMPDDIEVIGNIYEHPELLNQVTEAN